MPSMVSILAIFFTLAAAMAAYAFLMSILKKDKNTCWLPKEAHFTTAFSLAALTTVFPTVLSGASTLVLLFAGVLTLASFNAIILSVIQAKNITQGAPYPEAITVTSRTLAIVAFSFLVLAILILLGAVIAS